MQNRNYKATHKQMLTYNYGHGLEHFLRFARFLSFYRVFSDFVEFLLVFWSFLGFSWVSRCVWSPWPADSSLLGLFRSLWGPLGSFRGRFGSLWDPFGVPLGSPWPSFRALRGNLGLLGPPAGAEDAQKHAFLRSLGFGTFRKHANTFEIRCKYRKHTKTCVFTYVQYLRLISHVFACFLRDPQNSENSAKWKHTCVGAFSFLGALSRPKWLRAETYVFLRVFEANTVSLLRFSRVFACFPEAREAARPRNRQSPLGKHWRDNIIRIHYKLIVWLFVKLTSCLQVTLKYKFR